MITPASNDLVDTMLTMVGMDTISEVNHDVSIIWDFWPFYAIVPLWPLYAIGNAILWPLLVFFWPLIFIWNSLTALPQFFLTPIETFLMFLHMYIIFLTPWITPVVVVGMGVAFGCFYAFGGPKMVADTMAELDGGAADAETA